MTTRPPSSVSTMRFVTALFLVVLFASPVAAIAQGAADTTTTALGAEPVSLVIANRPVFEFRANVLGYPPATRAKAALERFNDVMNERGPGVVTSRRIDVGASMEVDGRWIFLVTPADVDPMKQQSFEQLCDLARLNLEAAVAATIEAKSATSLVRGALLAILATVIFLLAIKYLLRVARWAGTRLETHAHARVEKLRLPATALTAQLIVLLRLVLRLTSLVLGLVLAYSWLAFVLNQFSYTSPWGDQLGHYLSATVGTVLLAILRSVPSLLMLVIIFALARIATRWIRLLFDAVRDGRMELPGVDADTAMPTQRLIVIFVWVLAIALAYPFIPGSGGPAFQGITVLLGLMVSLGASNVVSQAASGYILMYSRSLRIGDYVRVDDHEGTIVSMSMLSTKIRTPRDEEINIPNAVIVNSITKNYTRLTRDTGAVLPTSVTIGYNTPWRQVHAMLIDAAERTAGIRKDSRPRVLQAALSDFYVEYTLLVRLERPDTRATVASALHANIQDAFNENEVQIMSPHYEADPGAKVWVPKEKWHEPPGDRADV
jgi:small-conductance mechanosensitive channel